MGFFKRLVQGLSKTRKNISRVFGFSKLDDDFYDELEEALISADIGVETTEELIEDLKEKVDENDIKEPAACRDLLVSLLTEKMDTTVSDYAFEDKKSVILVIGVNGVGKTTTVGKLSSFYRSKGKKVMMAAADTFRAGATDQLKVWADRSGASIVSAEEGADPGSVVFDAIESGKAKGADIIIVDTAGRLNNKKNLMNELSKINKIIDKAYPEAAKEVLIVLDSTTGQNALSQARDFKDVAEIDGIVLTKLDGTAKGGIAVAIQSKLGVPVKYVGVGEGVDDLQRFNAKEFVEALFIEEKESED